LQQLGHHVVVIKVQRGNGPEVVSNFHGIEVRCINLSSKKIDRFYCNMKSRLREKKIKRREFDVVSIHIVSMPITEAVVSECKKSKVPSVVHYHGLNVFDIITEQTFNNHIYLPNIDYDKTRL
jgi:hypothetical protein